MSKRLAECFLPEQEYYLDRISYNRIPQGFDSGEFTLVCNDDVTVEKMPDGVKVAFSRVVKFDPEGVFDMTIVFGAHLRFAPGSELGESWSAEDLSTEIKKDGGFVLANLVPRTSLLIAEISSSFGQPPIILPPRPNFVEE